MDTVVPLLLKAATKQKEEESRRRRDVQFPQSAVEYHRNQDKEFQQRLARFLTSDGVIQEKMLNDYGWTLRQVQGLNEVYSLDVRPDPIYFASRSNNVFQPTFKEEIQRRVAVVKDPRRKPTA